MKVALYCVSAILVALVGIAALNKYNPVLAHQIGEICSAIVGVLIVLALITGAIYMKFFYNPRKKRERKTVVYILLSIAGVVLALAALTVYALVQYFTFVTSGSFEGIVTGIGTIVLLVLASFIAGWIKEINAKQEQLQKERREYNKKEAERAAAFKERNRKPIKPQHSFEIPKVKGESTATFDKHMQPMSGAEILLEIGGNNWNMIPKWRDWHLAWEQEALRRLESEFRGMSDTEIISWVETYGDTIVSLCTNQSSKSTSYWTNELPDGLTLEWDILLSPQFAVVEKARKQAETERLLRKIREDEKNRLLDAVAAGKDVCWDCETISPDRCTCGQCTEKACDPDAASPNDCDDCWQWRNDD